VQRKQNRKHQNHKNERTKREIPNNFKIDDFEQILCLVASLFRFCAAVNMITPTPSNFNEDHGGNPPKSQSSHELLEEAFSLIRTGNESKEHDHRWKAADMFWQASTILKQLGDGEGELKQPQGKDNPKQADEQAKILQLYKQQSIEYRKRSRHVLIEELQDLTKNDRIVDKDNDNGMATSQRLDVFARIFAGRTVDRNVTAQTEHANADPKLMEEQESSLENRLSQLNSLLPPNLKSEAERVRDLNRGLRRLGLSGIDDGGTSGQQFQRSWVNDVLTHVHNKSESEQVDEIIAQVQDHVALNPNEYHTNHQEDDHVSMSSASSSSAASLQDIDDDSNEVDAPPPETCREIHAALISAQVHLAELIALLEVDEDDQAAIEFDASHGCKALSTTRRLLQNASRQWKNATSSSTNQPM
jgi:hypothetical protein